MKPTAEAIRLAHLVAVHLDAHAPIAAVAEALETHPWNLTYREACEQVGAVLRQPRERDWMNDTPIHRVTIHKASGNFEPGTRVEITREDTET
jgi:hypothetical protein